jgi:hypothetical protein
LNRKVRFGLVMPKQNNIRDIDALRQNFDLRCVLQYYYNGKLLVWLKDRNYIDYVRKLEAFSAHVRGLELFGTYDYTKLEDFFYTLFDVPYYSWKYYDNNLVFNQDELESLLGLPTKRVIYLCGGYFSLSVKYINMTYIGINNPNVYFVDLKDKEDLSDFNISLNNVHLLDHEIANIYRDRVVVRDSYDNDHGIKILASDIERSKL